MSKPNGTRWPSIVWVLLGVITAAVMVAVITFVMGHFAQPPRVHIKPVEPRPQLWKPTEVPPDWQPPIELPVVVTPSDGVSETLPISPSIVSASVVGGYAQGQGKIALVIDDVGMDGPHSAQLLAIVPPAVTLAFLVEGEATQDLAAKAAAQGHSIILHLPMEPQGSNAPPLGPYGLRVGMDGPTLVAQVAKNLAQLPTVEGVNNHMGSHFTQWEAGMQVVLTELAGRGLYFLDSRTAAPTATETAAEGLNLGLAKRDVFLDHDPTEAAVRVQLQRAVQLAQKRQKQGNTLPVVVIGHPLPPTLAVLQADLPLLQGAGIELVPLREAVR